MKRLLEKYRRGIISTDELKQLSAGMDAASDSELAGLLEKEWMNENRKKSRLRLWMGITAGIMMVAALSSAIYLADIGGFKSLSDKYVAIESGTSDKSSVLLPDGTKVILNANSRIEYA